jgi:hypothetical protein
VHALRERDDLQLTLRQQGAAMKSGSARDRALSWLVLCGLLALPGCAGFGNDPPPQAAAPPPAVAASQPPPPAPPPQPAAPPPAPARPATAPAIGPDGLARTELRVGTGAVAQNGQRVRVHYTGTFTNGSTFDSSVGGQPFVFTLGGGQVIRGWDQGLAGMRVGGKRKLVIPPALAYGAAGVPPRIPPNSTLVFEVELLGIE